MPRSALLTFQPRSAPKETIHLFVCSPAPGPGTAARHLGRRAGQPRLQRDLYIPDRRLWPGRLVDGRRPRDPPCSPRAAPAAVGSPGSGRAVRRHHPVHRRPGQGRQTNAEQVVARHALRSSLQAGFRAAGSIRQTQGRHQRLYRSIFSASGAKDQEEGVFANLLRAATGSRMTGNAVASLPLGRDAPPIMSIACRARGEARSYHGGAASANQRPLLAAHLHGGYLLSNSSRRRSRFHHVISDYPQKANPRVVRLQQDFRRRRLDRCIDG